ncbi:APC family permease [Campylobacter canadensis]|uniref:APC family permease n=1 Tax=Campylobacter canadensis TaxID=449520 RepID=UPI0021E11780|nr:APC family permease [Campylobacter canadensis]MBZ7998927.1 amino acid permease [Campylobacter canadensis]
MNNKKTFLSIKDIVFMNIISIVSLRQVLNAAPYGASQVILWCIAAFCFFIPLAMVCCELCIKYPVNGGIFIWVKEAFGIKTAWVVSVYYLMSCIVFFPMLLFFAFNSFFNLLQVENNHFLIMLCGIISFCAFTYFNILGIRYVNILNKIFIYLGIFIPILILCFLALVQISMGGGIN